MKSVVISLEAFNKLRFTSLLSLFAQILKSNYVYIHFKSALIYLKKINYIWAAQ